MDDQDKIWDDMLGIAKQLQQDYYELFAEWTIYKKNEYLYLKQNIGFAVFGPPTQSSATNDASNTCSSLVHYSESNFYKSNFTEAVIYEPKAQKHIDKLYSKICEHGKQYATDDSICYGLIYNVTFRNKKTETLKEEKDKKTKEVKKEIEEDSIKGKDDDDDINISVTPIFKIRRRISQEDNSEKTARITYDTWYIDISGRIYKSWEDYKMNNTLSECTMVLPKDGFYQPDPNYEVTELNSTVWLEVENSPACNTSAAVLQRMDLLSTVTGCVGLGVACASLLTPLGPIALGTGMVASGANGLWTFGRCTNNLLDRHQHEESISLTDREAFSSWLGVTGGVAGLAASGTSFLLSKAVKSGSTIGTSFRVVYNTSVTCNLGINGIGAGFQVYNMYETYQTEGRINPLDVISLTTHILFLGSAVCNLQFAGEFIESTQGKVLNDYRSSLRSRRLRKAYNRAQRTAAANNAGNQHAEHAEVIRYINKKQVSTFIVNNVHDVQFKNGKLTINGVLLLDPANFVLTFMKYGSFQTGNFEADSQMQNDSEFQNTATDQSESLKRLLEQLLTKLFWDDNYLQTKNIPTVPDFDSIIREMRYTKNAMEILSKMFKIFAMLVQRCKYFEDFIVEVIRFLWKYLLSTLREYIEYMGPSFHRSKFHVLILRVSTAMLDALDDIADSLIRSIRQYLSVVNHPPSMMRT